MPPRLLIEGTTETEKECPSSGSTSASWSNGLD
jgi:hypothetical protein